MSVINDVRIDAYGTDIVTVEVASEYVAKNGETILADTYEVQPGYWITAKGYGLKKNGFVGKARRTILLNESDLPENVHGEVVFMWATRGLDYYGKA